MNPVFTHNTMKQSVWSSTTFMPEFDPLLEEIATEVCIVGGGIAGLSTAFALLNAGKSVVVLENGNLAGGMTQASSAHLSSVPDCRFHALERLHGVEGAHLATQSHAAAIDQIERICTAERIDCDFERVDGYLFRDPSSPEDLLGTEYMAARNAGVEVYMSERSPLPFDSGPCLRFPNQAQFHPLRYLEALVYAITRAGGRIYTHTRAEKIQGSLPAIVTTPHGKVTAQHIVVATNNPVNDLLAIHTKQRGYMTYMLGARVPRGSINRALYWDTAKPYHYVRLQEMHTTLGEMDILIIGGEDHRTGQEMDPLQRYARLQHWAREHFPMIEEFEYEWSCQVMESFDGLGFIGRNPMDFENVYVVTGDSGMDMTHGTIASMLITDLIEGRENPWTTLYLPARITLRAAGSFVKEQLNAAAQYADWATRGDVDSLEEIASGSGAVIRRGFHKIAVYRDRGGHLHEYSAMCPHLGGVVHWNDTEKTWDCPCHGSRFSNLGEPLNGPANKPLQQLPVNSEPPNAHEIGMSA